jgi:hypothetical protein
MSMIYHTHDKAVKVRMPHSITELLWHIKEKKPVVLDYEGQFLILKVLQVTCTSTTVEITTEVIPKYGDLVSCLKKKWLLLTSREFQP